MPTGCGRPGRTSTASHRPPPVHYELQIANCRLQISPPTRSAVGGYGGRAVFDNVGSIQLIHSASEVPTLSKAATSESASGRWAPRNESIEANAGARIPMPAAATAIRDRWQRQQPAPAGLWPGLPLTSAGHRLFIPWNDPEVTHSMPRKQLIAAPDDCPCSLHPAAVAERCLSGPDTRIRNGLRRGKRGRTGRHPHLTLSRMNPTFNFQPSTLDSRVVGGWILPQERDRPVVDQVHLHHRTKDPGLHR